MKEDKVLRCFTGGIADHSAGNRELPGSLIEERARTVASKVVKPAGAGQTANLLCVQVALNPGQTKGADAAYVDPGSQYG